MPVMVRKMGNKWRVVEKATGRIAMTSKGNPHDGGGHSSESSCQKQVNAMNAALHGWKPTKRK